MTGSLFVAKVLGGEKYAQVQLCLILHKIRRVGERHGTGGADCRGERRRPSRYSYVRPHVTHRILASPLCFTDKYFFFDWSTSEEVVAVARPSADSLLGNNCWAVLPPPSCRGEVVV